MSQLKQIFSNLKENIDELNFSETIRNARDCVGLMQYRAAEHLRMTIGRLKNLETGYFRVMPTASEIRNLCDFYGLPHDQMISKAEEYVSERKRKVRGVYEKSTV